MTTNEIIFETPQIDGLSVTINGVATNNPSNILWNWGDGTSEQSQWFPASHVYAQAGTYTISASANYGGYSVGETYSASTSTSTTITISESYITSSSTPTSTSSDTIMQFVYWYPPYEMTESDISAIGSLGASGLVAVNIDTGILFNLFGNNIVNMASSTNTAQIFLTPEAYTNWYKNNIETLAGNTTLTFWATTLESSANGYSDYEEANQAYIEKLGYYWRPYNSSYANTYNVASASIDPVKSYGFPSTELYMLIAPAGSTSTTTFNSLSLQTETDQNNQAVQNQTNNTTSLAQIISSDISSIITYLTQGNSSSTTTTTSTTNTTPPPSNPPSIFSNIDFDIALGIVGVLGVVGTILLLS